MKVRRRNLIMLVSAMFLVPWIGIGLASLVKWATTPEPLGPPPIPRWSTRITASGVNLENRVAYFSVLDDYGTKCLIAFEIDSQTVAIVGSLDWDEGKGESHESIWLNQCGEVDTPEFLPKFREAVKSHPNINEYIRQFLEEGR